MWFSICILSIILSSFITYVWVKTKFERELSRQTQGDGALQNAAMLQLLPHQVQDPVQPVQRPGATSHSSSQTYDEPIYCQPCGMYLNGPRHYKDHLLTKKHRNKVVRSRETQWEQSLSDIAVQLADAHARLLLEDASDAATDGSAFS